MNWVGRFSPLASFPDVLSKIPLRNLLRFSYVLNLWSDISHSRDKPRTNPKLAWEIFVPRELF